MRDTKCFAMKCKEYFSPVKLTVYVDCSFANGSDRKSIYGFVVYFNEQLLHHKSKLQPVVSQSSTEAEFVAMALKIKEIKWILQMLEELQCV